MTMMSTSIKCCKCEKLEDETAITFYYFCPSCYKETLVKKRPATLECRCGFPFVRNYIEDRPVTDLLRWGFSFKFDEEYQKLVIYKCPFCKKEQK